MPKDKYPSIFSPQMETIVFIILQIFFATRAVLKIGEYCVIAVIGAEPAVKYSFVQKGTETRRKCQYNAKLTLSSNCPVEINIYAFRLIVVVSCGFHFHYGFSYCRNTKQKVASEICLKDGAYICPCAHLLRITQGTL